MTSNKVTISDIEKTMLKLSQKETMLKQKPLAEDVITLDDSSDEDNGNATATVADGQNNRGMNTSETSSEDASLLATLRLLASLNSGTKQTLRNLLSWLTRWQPWGRPGHKAFPVEGSSSHLGVWSVHFSFRTYNFLERQ